MCPTSHGFVTRIVQTIPYLSFRDGLPLVQHVHEAEYEDGDHVDAERDEEHEEVSVVPPADAVVHPGAVVVEHLDAVVAHGAVRAARRAVELAGDAPLHADGDAVDLHVAVERGAEVVVAVLVGAGARDHAGVHEGGQAEVHQDEQGDDALDDRHDPDLLVQKVPLDASAKEELQYLFF